MSSSSLSIKKSSRSKGPSNDGSFISKSDKRMQLPRLMLELKQDYKFRSQSLNPPFR